MDVEKKEKYDELNKRANILYKFVIMYSDFMKIAHDYGTGEIVNMVEIHTLAAIAENPGVTVTEVAQMWNRTKGAVSQNVAKLEKRGLIERKKENGNAKNVHLYITKKGKMLDLAHKKYDLNEYVWVDKILRNDFTDEEVNVFYKIMQRYIELLQAEE